MGMEGRKGELLLQGFGEMAFLDGAFV